MDFLEADQILSDYGEAFFIKDTERHRSENELKNTKKEIVLAFKIWYIREIKFPTLSQEEFAIHNNAIISLGIFAPHNDACFLNDYDKAIENKQEKEFIEAHPGGYKLISSIRRKIFDTKAHDEVIKFVDSIKELDKQDPLYYQKAYMLADTEYRTEYKETFENPQAAYTKRLEKIYRFNDRGIPTPNRNNQVSNKKIVLVKKEETKINSTNDYKEVKWISLSLIVLIAMLMLVYYVK